MIDTMTVLFGGLVALAVFFLRELLDVLRYIQERRDFQSMMTIIEALATEEIPISCPAITAKTDLRFGLFRRKAVGKVRRLCYRMIRDKTLCYSQLPSTVADPQVPYSVGYFLPTGGGR
jgi:hypothetical protein